MAIGTQVEIHIRAQQEGRYPVEITLTDAEDGRRHFAGHMEARTWVPSASPGDDGQRLFRWLFADHALRTAWDRVSEHRPHPLRLRIDAGAPELHAIHWELLQEPVGGGISRHLAADSATPFSRYPVGDWPPQQPLADRPIRILAAIADPDDLGAYNLAPLQVETERGIIADAFRGLAAGQVQLSFLESPVTLLQLEAALKRGCNLLHLVAHGRHSGKLGKGVLYLADDDGRVALEADRDLAAMIDRLNQEERPALVFLASCQGATRDTTAAFRGLAPALIEVGVPAVLAMQDVVEVNTVRAFTRAFYQHLFAHGQVDLACNEARSALLTGGFPGSSIPVLFSRLADNRLLAFLPGAATETRYYEPETVLVPDGRFLMGCNKGKHVSDHETPQHVVDLPAYRIGKYPVTNGQYAEFIRHTARMVAPEANWAGQVPPADKLNHPVSGVSWYDALAYCEWLSEQTGRHYSLPSEAQWEKAARGTDGRVYPWGNEWDASRCNHGNEQTTPVGTYPEGISPYGCHDMVGNVREWTSTLWGEKLREPDRRFCYPWANDHREDLTASHYILRVFRGGGAADRIEALRCSARGAFFPDRPGPPRRLHGFRVALLEAQPSYRSLHGSNSL